MALSTLANLRTGISLSFSGVNGVDWMVEPRYYDTLTEDRAVIYVKSTTLLSLANNALNRIWYGRDDPRPYAGSLDKIRYRVDGDLNYGPAWADIFTTPFPLYTAPLSFATLQYPVAQGSLPVYRRIGNNGGDYKSKTARFWYGLLDAYGNEVHTLCVAHDDSQAGITTDTEYWASDGRMYVIVVDPVTPVLQVRSVSTGQFYTTPLKTYFQPKVHVQITYFSGTCEFELKDLGESTIEYRINGGSWVSALNPVLTDANFSAGTNTLEYRVGSSGPIASRTIVKNPTHPSLAESHGTLRVGSDDHWNTILARLSREPYASSWTRMVRDRSFRTAWDTVRRQGQRIYKSWAVTANMIAAKRLGNDAMPTSSGTARSYAAYAKEMALENFTLVDCIGFEENQTGGFPHPTREWIYRGYWDVAKLIDFAYGYDLLVGLYRSDQHANGVTPIEDYFLRDCLASAVSLIMSMTTNHQGRYLAPPGSNPGGMWDTCWKCGALVGMHAMPGYSTPYYGTSGFDGQTAVYTYTPWATAPLTWKKALIGDDAPRIMYPDTAGPLGMNELMPETGIFQDKVSYMSLCGPVFFDAMWVCKWRSPEKLLLGPEACFLAAALGTLRGTKTGGLGPSRWLYLGILNASWPDVADAAIDLVRDSPSTSATSDNQLAIGYEMSTLIGYDDAYISGAEPVTQAPVFTVQPVGITRTEGQSATFTVSVTGIPTPTLQWRKDGVNISGQTGTSYTISSTVLASAGVYDCVATNSTAPLGIVSAAATLVVNAVPPPPPVVSRRNNSRSPGSTLQMLG